MAMSPARARACAVAAAITVTAALFLLTGALPLPVPLYFPLSRRFAFTGAPGELSMDYYGRSLLACGAGILSYGAAYLLCRRLRPGRGLSLWTAYAATALWLCASLFAYKLYYRQPSPEPLPTWYRPR